MPTCDGKETHSHYVLASGDLFFHAHEHTVSTKEFNRLHHHAPKEHDNFTVEELENGATIVKVPF
jgi:hypothetical protein